MKIAVNIFLGIAFLIVAFSLVLVYANTHPPRYPLNLPPSEFRAEYEDVSFTTADGVRLNGWLIIPNHPRATSPAIIICHGVGANKSDFTELAVAFSRRGYFVLTFDFRAHGESAGARTSLGYLEQKDVTAALTFLRSREDINPKRIGIYGFSMGGAAAVLVAAKTDGFAAVVADSAFKDLKGMARTVITSFHHLPAFPFLQLTTLGYDLYFQTDVNKVSPVSVIGSVAPVPLLLIAGDGDKLVPLENGRRLYEAAREPKELWVIPAAVHGGTMASAGREYERRVGGFFDKNLKQSHSLKP